MKEVYTVKPVLRDCALITWRGAGWETRGGHRENHTERGGVDVKFNTYGQGHYFFHSFSQTRKVVEELCSYLLTLELNWKNINSRCFDL